MLGLVNMVVFILVLPVMLEFYSSSKLEFLSPVDINI